MKVVTFAILSLWVTSNLVFAGTEVANRDEIRKNFDINRYSIDSRLSQIKIAILDNGFSGFDASRGLLPATTEHLSLTQIPEAPTPHGLLMAQTIWGLTNNFADGPKFYLINTNGFSNFKAAVEYVIENKIDIVLYAQVWPFGSNFDGTGFINAQVNKAIQAGVLWVNAAGNHHQMIYNGLVKSHTIQADFLKFGPRDYLRFENKIDENQVTLTLSWNDFQESELHNTNKDLDVFVYDVKDQLVGSGELIQRGEAPVSGGEPSQLSSHARETIKLQNLDRGTYKIKVKVKSQNFINTDRFRVLLVSDKFDAVKFTDHTKGSEIMPPADNLHALTVGEMGPVASVGPTSDLRIKPDVVVQDARVDFTNGAQIAGTSSASALVAGTLAILKANRSGINLAWVKQYIKSLSTTVSGGSVLVPAPFTELDPYVKSFVPTGAQIKRHMRNFHVILTPHDPILYPSIKSSGIKRNNPDDILVLNPGTKQWSTYPKQLEDKVALPYVVFARDGSFGTGKVPQQPAPIGGASPVWKTP
jgi:hypothetical protein